MPVLYNTVSERDVYRGRKYLRWGIDDLYPQRCIDLVDECPQLEMAIRTRAMFIAGQGAEDEALGSTVVNYRGQTVNDCIRASARDCQEIPVVALHIRYNGLLEVAEVTPIEVERFRVGEPDDRGFVSKVYLAKKYQSFLHRTKRKNKIVEYDVFNPRPEVVLKQIAAAGGISKYRGQIAYAFIGAKPGARTYPKAWYHSAIDSIETIISNNKSIKRDTKQGFAMRTKITKYGFGEEPTPKEKRKAREEIAEFMGDSGASSWLEFAANKDSKTDIDAFETAALEKVYSYSKSSSSDDVFDSSQIPRILYGQAVAGKLGTRDEFDQAINYVSACVVDSIQRQIEELYTRVFTAYARPILKGKLKIKNLTIENFFTAKAEPAALPVPPVNADPNADPVVS